MYGNVAFFGWKRSNERLPKPGRDDNTDGGDYHGGKVFSFFFFFSDADGLDFSRGYKRALFWASSILQNKGLYH